MILASTLSVSEIRSRVITWNLEVSDENEA